MNTFLDAHGTAIHIIAAATVLGSFAFVAGSVVIERIRNRRAPPATGPEAKLRRRISRFYRRQA